MFLPVGLPTDDVPTPANPSLPCAEHALHALMWGTGRRGLNFVFNVCGSGFASPLYLRVLQEAALATTQRRASVLPIDGTGGGAWEAGTQTRGHMANGPFWSVKVGPSAGIPTGKSIHPCTLDRWDGWVDVYILHVCMWFIIHGYGYSVYIYPSYSWRGGALGRHPHRYGSIYIYMYMCTRR
jgi:hypothetical protein